MTIPQTPLEHVRVRDAMHTGILTTDPSTPLRVVARQMVEHCVSHLVVVDPATGHPIGILSALDVAAAYAA